MSSAETVYKTREVRTPWKLREAGYGERVWVVVNHYKDTPENRELARGLAGQYLVCAKTDVPPGVDILDILPVFREFDNEEEARDHANELLRDRKKWLTHKYN